jgi:hypothetical protein
LGFLFGNEFKEDSEKIVHLSLIISMSYCLPEEIRDKVKELFQMLQDGKESKDWILVLGPSGVMLEAAQRNQIGYVEKNIAFEDGKKTVIVFRADDEDPSQ